MQDTDGSYKLKFKLERNQLITNKIRSYTRDTRMTRLNISPLISGTTFKSMAEFTRQWLVLPKEQQ